MKERLQSLSFAAVALIVVFGSLLGIVVLQTFIVQTRVELDQLDRELQTARDHNRQLRLAVIELEAPERVLSVAIERLGMTRPDQRRYLPGIDPAVEQVSLPTSDNPFGPAPLPDYLAGDEPPADDAEQSP